MTRPRICCMAMALLGLLPQAAPQAARAAEPATTRAVVHRLVELFRVDLTDRRLDIVIVPPPEQLGAAVASRGADSPGAEADAGVAASFEFEAPGEEKWQVQASPPADPGRRRDGGCTEFAVSCDSRADDRWSPLQLTAVSADAQATTITGVGRIGRISVTVTLRQDARLHDVRFTVQRSRRLRPRPVHEFAAQDLVQLYNEHPQELRQYLFPLLKEITATNPLRPRAGDVYIAFPSLPADPVAMEKVRALLPELDAGASSQRDVASAKLGSIGPAAVGAAARIERSDLTPEQVARLDAFVARNSTFADPAAAARSDPYFLVDCLRDDNAAVRTEALAALRRLLHREIAFDVAAPAAQRERAADELIDMLDEQRDSPNLAP